MTSLVADANVIVKWVLPQRDHEQDVTKALDLLSAIKDGHIALHQPPHWLAEVAAVVVRLSPDTAEDDITDLYQLSFAVVDHPAIYHTACDLASSLHHHLFDTLYHAVALNTPGITFVTADEHYYKKAKAHGHILLLRDWTYSEKEA